MRAYESRFDTEGRLLPHVAAVLQQVNDELGVHLVAVPWHDEDEGIDMVLAPAGVTPCRPVWEMHLIAHGQGDCLALHPWAVSDDDPAEMRHILHEAGLHSFAAAARDLGSVIAWAQTGRAPARQAGSSGSTSS